MKTYENYLLDLYGTLVDIHTDEEAPSFWRNVSRLLGMQGVHLSPAVLKAKYEAQIALQENELRSRLPEGAQPEVNLAPVFRSFFADSGVRAAMLDALHRAGKKVYLRSNAQSLFTRPELTLLGLDTRLDGILLSSEAGRKKPDPEFFRLLMERFGLDPSKTVMVGNDDQCDSWGAAEAELDSFYVCTAQSPKRTAPLPENCRELKKIADLTSTF